MSDWKQEEIIRRADGSFVIKRNGLPYHVPNSGEWQALHAEIAAYCIEHPDGVTEEEAPSVEDVLERTKAIKLSEFDTVMQANDSKAIRAILSGEEDVKAYIASVQEQNRVLRKQVVDATSSEDISGVTPVAVNITQMLS